MVTGASSGIGAALARQLAAAGTDLLLVGRDESALASVAADARQAGCDVVVLPADLATVDGLRLVVATIEHGDPMIDLLVNNAGIGQMGRFVDLNLDDARELMRVNNDALVTLTHTALLRMLARGHGSIVQISSTASAAPGPDQAVYAATKAFVTSFGQALSIELQGTGVTCTTVLPGFTWTRYFERGGRAVDVPDKYWMTADDVARLALEGASARRPLVIPGAVNRREVRMAAMFPSSMKGRTVKQIQRLRHVAHLCRSALLRRLPSRNPQRVSRVEDD
jgi:short-subunit dehydrogenase